MAHSHLPHNPLKTNEKNIQFYTSSHSSKIIPAHTRSLADICTFTLFNLCWLHLPQPVIQRRILLIQTAFTAASAQTPRKATQTYSVWVGHMCLSMHQWFRLIHFMLHSTRMFALTIFSVLFHKGRRSGPAVQQERQWHKGEVTDTTANVYRSVLSTFYTSLLIHCDVCSESVSFRRRLQYDGHLMIELFFTDFTLKKIHLSTRRCRLTQIKGGF